MEPNKNMRKINWDDAFVNFMVTFGVLIGASILSAAIHKEDHSGSTAAIMIFVLAVLVIARITKGYVWGIAASFVGVIVVNFIFTYPYYELNFSLTGYPLTFVTMLVVSIITSATSTQLKRQEELRVETEKEQVRFNLLRAISHDIRTPLTSIVGSTSVLLENNGLSDEQKEQLLQDVHDDGEWLIRVTENILSITRMGGDNTIVKTPELAEEVVESAVRNFHKRRNDEVNVIVNMPQEPLLIPMDVILIEQVLSNLLENAVVHGKNTTSIVIDIEANPEYAQFSVTNDGVVIPEYKFATLFNGTFKSDNDTSGGSKRSMGIGLAVCRTVIEAHGGTISAYNLDDNSGVVFTFTLPMESGV